MQDLSVFKQNIFIRCIYEVGGVVGVTHRRVYAVAFCKENGTKCKGFADLLSF